MDGFTLTRNIKQDGRFKDVPVIIHSSLTGTTNEGHVKSVGADAYIAKFMAEELGEQAYCMGTHISMADLAVGSALGYLAFRFADINWQENHPNLGKLYAKLQLRASFTDTAPHD